MPSRRPDWRQIQTNMMICFRTFSFPCTFEQTDSVWISKLSYSSITTPNSVILFTKGTFSPLHLISMLFKASILVFIISVLGIYFHLKSIAFDFPTLSRSLLWANHEDIISKSASNKLIMLWSELPAQKSDVSSAKIDLFELSCRWQRSFMKMMNRSGPSTEPWGTPDFSFSFLDSFPLKWTIE